LSPLVLPYGLLILSCSECNLSELPELPTTLTQLICYNNNLIELPGLHNPLNYILCGNNKLRELPQLPNGLEIFYCSKNPIKFITPENYEIMKKIWIGNKNNNMSLCINETIFYNESNCNNYNTFFKC
jgi:hypothetical protein